MLASGDEEHPSTATAAIATTTVVSLLTRGKIGESC
jgi:hypothetical protein